MAKDVILEASLGGETLAAEELAAIPDFSEIPKEIWKRFLGAIVHKKCKPGEILMREGENGTTAFVWNHHNLHQQSGFEGGESSPGSPSGSCAA